MERPELVGAVCGATALALVGSSFAASAKLTSYPVATGQAARYAVCGLLLAGIARGRLVRPRGRQLALACALSASGLAAFNGFVIAAVRASDAAAVGVVVGCVPVLLALSPLLRGARVSRRLLGAAVVVTIGAAAVQAAGASPSLPGFLLAGGALACEAAFTLFAVPLLGPLGPLGVSTWACLLAVPMLVAWALVVDGASALVAPTASEALALAWLALPVTAGAFLLWYSGVVRLGPERAGLLAGVLPVSAALAAVAVDGAPLDLPRLAGVVAVGLGMTFGLAGTATR